MRTAKTYMRAQKKALAVPVRTIKMRAVSPVIQPKHLDRPASVVDSSSSQLDEDSDAEASTLAAMLGRRPARRVR